MKKILKKDLLLNSKNFFLKERINISSEVFLVDLVSCFLSSLSNEGTRTRYYYCFKKIFSEEVLRETYTLQDINKINLNSRLDSIFFIKSLSKVSKQTCAAAFLSFFKFLYRETSGLINIPTPQKSGVSKTFSKIRDKTVFSPLSKKELHQFILKSYDHSLRMGVFVEMAIQSSKRLSELLNVRVSDIDWENHSITFSILKSSLEKKCIISFPNKFMQKLSDLIKESKTDSFVFITSTGKKLQKDYVWRQLKSISSKSNLLYHVTPHVLRATSISLYRDYGFSLGDLVEITGHSSIEMVRYYDKNSFKNNPSSKVALI